MTDDRDDPTARGRNPGSREGANEGPADRNAQDTPGDRDGAQHDDVVDPEVVDLQLLLQQIAASAGDPPEHGLAGVAARRRRRKRHRRGAVATAMTLAVVATLAMPYVLRDDDHDVTAADAASTGAPRRAELPDKVQLSCVPTGIDVPVASIRPQDDGLHIEVVNGLAGSTQVWVRATDEDDPDELVWDSGPLYVERGRHLLIQPVPPGVLTIGCRIGGVEQQRQVELVDVDRLYEEPELSCADDDEATTLVDVTVPANTSGEPARSYVVATRAALRPLTSWDDGDVTVTEPRGYPDQNFGSWSYQPMTEVVRDGDVVALVDLAGDDDAAPASAPWTRAPRIDVCRSFLNDAGRTLADV